MQDLTLGKTDLSAASHRVANSLGGGSANTSLGRPGAPASRTPALAGTGASAKTATTAAATASANITSNDFLTLLVSELKNQDPTQPTDPNAYVQQLVGVNSLQQLIAINQDLSGSAASKKAESARPVQAF